jgi:GNAT superfamily N-acetyltransferase
VIEVEAVPVERLDEVLDVRNRVDPDDPLELATLVRGREREPDRVHLLARVDGVAAGVGVYSKLLDHPGSTTGRISLRVLPELRRRGVATALHRAVSEVARRHGDVELEGLVVAPTTATEAYCATRGYRVVERMVESRLRLDLDTAAPAPELPCDNLSQGIARLAVRAAADDPAVLEDAYLVALEAEPDIPQAREWVRPASFEEWHAREIDDAAFVPEASLVLYVDDVPAAYGLLSLQRAGVAEHFATGVARALRGRGVAHALKRAQIARAREVGLRELVAWNDETNAPIRRVNEKLGYRVTRDVVAYRGPLL